MAEPLSDKKQKNKGAKAARILMVLIFLTLVGAGVDLYVRYNRTHISTDDAYVKGHIHWIAPRIPGTVIQVRIDDNQFVKKGQDLVNLDPAKYQVELEQAQAALAVSKSKLAETQANVTLCSTEIELNRAEFQDALRDFNRAKLAYPNKAISKQQYDHYLTAYKVAMAKLANSRERLKLAMDQIKSAEAQIRVGQARVHAARLNLKYTRIVAPVSGYITKKNVEVGMRTGPQRPLFAIVPLNDIWIVANYKENQLRHVHPGQNVTIKVSAFPNERLSGKVESVQAGTGAVFSLFPPENATGNWVKITQRVPVKIIITSSNKNILRIGMSVETTIRLK